MIQVQNLSKDFSLNKKQRKELGDEYKNTKILRAVDNISFECQPGEYLAYLDRMAQGKPQLYGW